MTKIAISVFSLALLALMRPCACHAATYYISPSGTGEANGTLAEPYPSVRSVYGKIRAGDTVLIQSGTTVTGAFYVSAPGLTVGVYGGTAPATIESGVKSGLFYQSSGNLSVSNINFVGAGGTNTAGISLYNPSANVTQQGITLADVTATGYTWGMYVASSGANAGYDDVKIMGCSFFANTLDGLASYSLSPASNENWTVTGSSFDGNIGVNQTANSGSGLCLGMVDDAVVSHCNAWNNGNPGNGGVGIWTYESNAVTISECTSHDNHTGGAQDGDGFDLDGGVTNSVIKDCATFGNDGSGYVDCQYPGATPNTGNKIVDNTSCGDGKKNSYAGVFVYSECSDLTISGNKIIALPGSCTGGCIKGLDWTGKGVVIGDNTLDIASAPATIDINWPDLSGTQITANTTLK